MANNDLDITIGTNLTNFKSGINEIDNLLRDVTITAKTSSESINKSFDSNDKGINKLKDSANNLGKEFDVITKKYADRAVKAVNSVDTELKGINQMKAEIKRLRIEMDNAAIAGDKIRFEKASKSLGELKNDFKDANARMKLLDPREILNGWVRFGQGALGSMAALTGAMTLFGSKNEDVQELERKSMAIIQMMMGLESARQILIDKGGQAELKALFSTTGAQLKKLFMHDVMVTSIVAETVATEAQTVATEEATTAQAEMNVVAMANPYVILAVAIGALVVGLATYAANSREIVDIEEKGIPIVKKLAKENDNFSGTMKINLALAEATLPINKALADTWEYLRVKLGGLTDAQIKHLEIMGDDIDKSKMITESKIRLAEAQGKTEKEVFVLKREYMKEELSRNNILLKNTELTSEQREKILTRQREIFDFAKSSSFEYRILLEKENTELKKNKDAEELALLAKKQTAQEKLKAEMEAKRNALDKKISEIKTDEDEPIENTAWYKNEMYFEREKLRVKKEFLEASQKAISKLEQEFIDKVAEGANKPADFKPSKKDEFDRFLMSALGVKGGTAEEMKGELDKKKEAVKEMFVEIQKITEEFAQQQVDLAQKRKSEIESEISNNLSRIQIEQKQEELGHNNSVESLKKRDAQLQKQREKVLKDLERANKIQLAINTAQEASQLTLAIAKIWSGNAGTPVIGVALSAALTAIMIGSFIASKAMALNAAKTTKYREGGSILLNGQSHEQGGIRLLNGHEAEGGELVGIFNKDATRKNSGLPYLIDGINKGKLILNKDAMTDVANNRQIIVNVGGQKELQDIRNLLYDQSIKNKGVHYRRYGNTLTVFKN